MAQLRRIAPANPISNYPAQVRPGPSIFGVLADGAEVWAAHTDMLATEVARREGAEQGAGASGGYQPGSLGGNPAVPGVPGAGGQGYNPAAFNGPLANEGSLDAAWGGSQGGARGLPISGDTSSNPEIYNLVSQAWAHIMPEGSRVEVFSAHRPGGSETSQHHSGDAIDFTVYRPDGSTVAWDDPEALAAAEFGAALGVQGFGAGFDYMGGRAFHWDRGQNPNNVRGGIQVWSDSDGVNNYDRRGAVSWLPRLQAAREMGVNGLLTAAGQPPVTTTPSSSGVPINAASPYGEAAVAQAQRAGVDPELFNRVIQQESAWNPDVVSSAGARGLTQVMPATGASPGFGVAPMSDPSDPEEQLRFGADYLAAMVQRYDGDVERALVAYNAGPGTADDWDGNRASLPEETRGYLASIVDGASGGNQGTGQLGQGSVVQTGAGPVASSSGPVTQIRNQSGELETRPIDIFTSRYDIIRQNAALGAYSAGVLNDAGLAMGDLRRQFALDPAGFQQAAQAYVQQIVGSAPSTIREQLGDDLRFEAARNFNGIRDDLYRNTLDRANNEAIARTDMLSTEYSTLLAAGDMEGAEAAQGRLYDILRYRASLPGSTLGPDQVEMVMRGAQSSAERMRTTGETNRNREIGSQLTSIRNAAADGRRHTGESILTSPEAQAHPDFNQTMGAVNMRDFMPDFASLPPSERAAMIEAERGRAVDDDWETGFLSGMEATHERALTREREDPMSAAGQNGVAIGTLDPSNPEAFAQTMMQRGAIAQEMVDQGYTTSPRFFTNEERDQLALAFGADADPAARSAFAGALIDTLGPQAGTAALELGLERSTAEWIQLTAFTGNRAAMTQALTGGALRRAGQARSIPQDVRMAPEVVALLETLPPVAGTRERIIEMAMDYASFSEGMGEATAVNFEDAVQLALGQSSTGGGIGEVFDGQMLLPPDMSARDMESAITQRILPASAMDMRTTEDGRIELLSPVSRDRLTIETVSEFPQEAAEREVIGTFDTMEQAQMAQFADHPQGAPMVGGEMISPREMRRLTFEPVVINGQIERGLYTATGHGFDVTDADGQVYIFNMRD